VDAIEDQSHMSEKKEPAYLYHYTTAEGLKGIIEKRELWATDIFYLNDWTEFYCGRDEFRRELDERSTWKDDSEKEVAKAVAELLQDPDSLGSNHVFVCSFSEDGNDLSQWRAYCQDGGYSIGFRRDQLERLLEVEDNWNLYECDYFLGESTRHVDRLLWLAGKIANSKNPDTSVQRIQSALCKFAAQYKDIGFKDEREWRLISVSTESNLIFRTRGAFLIPYVRFSLKDATLWKSVHIRVGPSSREADELRVRSTKMFLRSQGLPATCVNYVRASGIPYRTRMGG
jgi:hypothetical protein